MKDIRPLHIAAICLVLSLISASCATRSGLKRFSRYDLDKLINLQPEPYVFFLGEQSTDKSCFPSSLGNICKSLGDYLRGEQVLGEEVSVNLYYNIPGDETSAEELEFLNLAAASYGKSRGWKYFTIIRNARGAACGSYSTYETDTQLIGDYGYGTTYENKNTVCSFSRIRYFFFFDEPKKLKEGLFKLDLNSGSFYPFHDLYAEGNNLLRARKNELERMEESKKKDVTYLSMVTESAYRKFYSVEEMYAEVIKKYKLNEEQEFYTFKPPIKYKIEKTIEEKLMNTQ